jgi:DNA-binding response OmpR family regulator
LSARNAKKLKPALHELGSERQVTAVAVSPNPNDRAFLRDIFHEAQWTLHEVPCFREALLLMRRRPVDLIITERDLEDGSWRDLLEGLKALPGCPPLIVTSRLADEYLWAEVLNEGGFDVLAQPFDREEVVRVISAATRRMQNQFASREVRNVLSAGA